MTTLLDQVEHMLDDLDRDYDPEHESGSTVTRYDMDLYSTIQWLAGKIDGLNRRIADLESHANE